MSLHVNNGTTNKKVKKRYKSDGSVLKQVKKRYKSDGTSLEQVYSAAEPVTGNFNGTVYGQTGVGNKSKTIYGTEFDATDYKTLTVTSVLTGSENNNGNGGCDNYVGYTGAASDESGGKMYGNPASGTTTKIFDITSVRGIIKPSCRFSCYTAWTSDTVYSSVSVTFEAAPL